MTTSFSFKSIVPFLFLFLGISVSAQQFTRQDTLRGSITPERAWWDLKHYDIEVEVFPSTEMIQGINTMSYTALTEGDVLQIDLQEPMKLDKVIQDDKELKFTSEGSAHFIQLPKKQFKGEEYKVIMHFSGKPRMHLGMADFLGRKTKMETHLLQLQTRELEQVFGGQIKTTLMMNQITAST